MKIEIVETGEVKELHCVDMNGVDWVEELIGNTDSFGEYTDGKFQISDEMDRYFATADTYDWWLEYLNGYLATEQDIIDLADELNLDIDEVRDRIGKVVGNVDMDLERAAAVREIEEIRKDYQNF